MQLNDKRAWLYSVKLYMAAVATLGISLLGGKFFGRLLRQDVEFLGDVLRIVRLQIFVQRTVVPGK